MTSRALFWSKRGAVACANHAPAPGSAQWSGEAWRAVPHIEGRRIVYQCQFCDKRAIQKTRRTYQGDKPALILNVDDRPANLYARDRVLRLHGFTVANAETGKSALDVARQLQPNLILLDIHLPDVDGRDLCQQMKSDEEIGHIPIVLISSTLTGHVNQLDGIRWAKADGFLMEPVEGEMLASTLRNVLATAHG